MRTLDVSNTEAAEDTAAVGMAAVQLIFDKSMARFVDILLAWEQVSRAAVEGQPPSSAVGTISTPDSFASHAA